MTTLDLLDRLVSHDTTSALSNLPMIDEIQDYLTTRGYRVHRITDSGGTKAGLLAEFGPAGDGVLLSAHTDVVPTAGQPWTRAPYQLTRDGDRVYGRGTTDMKGFLAAMLRLADSATKRTLAAPLKLSISYDEEIGCVGIAHMAPEVLSRIGRPRACIVGEPTSMQVAIGHKGKRGYRVHSTGQSGHSALAPQFTNALHALMDMGGALRDLQTELARDGARDPAYTVPYSTVHIGRLSGGVALNMVPAEAEMDFEFRIVPGDDADALLARVPCPDGVRVHALSAYPGLDTDPDAAVVGWAQSMTRTTGTTKVAFGTEAGFFADLGIPTVVCGPGDMAGQGHQPDEFVTLDQLAACDAMLDRVLDDISA